MYFGHINALQRSSTLLFLYRRISVDSFLHCPCIPGGFSWSLGLYLRRFWIHIYIPRALHYRNPFLCAVWLGSGNGFSVIHRKIRTICYQQWQFSILTLRHSIAVPAWCWKANFAIVYEVFYFVRFWIWRKQKQDLELFVSHRIWGVFWTYVMKFECLINGGVGFLIYRTALPRGMVTILKNRESRPCQQINNN